MWQLELPWWELVLRAVIVYFFILVLIRVTGKRQIGELAPFDLILLLVLSETVQNALIADDKSVPAGMIAAITLVSMHYLVSSVTFKSRKIETLVEGRPQVLIHNGRLYHDMLAQEQITRHELNEALRENGCASVEEVHFAILETNGRVSVTRRPRDRRKRKPTPHQRVTTKE